jgi:hypothetical protein
METRGPSTAFGLRLTPLGMTDLRRAAAASKNSQIHCVMRIACLRSSAVICFQTRSVF